MPGHVLFHYIRDDIKKYKNVRKPYTYKKPKPKKDIDNEWFKKVMEFNNLLI